MRGVDVVCATPGRLNDHLIKRRTFVSSFKKKVIVFVLLFSTF